MMAVILAGGRGTRLRPFTVTIPKPLLPLGDIPILEVVIRQLVKAGCRRIVLTLGHMAPFFMTFIGDGGQWGAKIEYCCEQEPLGTAAPLRLVEKLDDDFIVMNGDILTTLDYNALFRAHRERKAIATIALSQREVTIDYGVVTLDEDGLLREYLEKPSIPYFVSMGVSVLSRRCLEFIPAGKKFDMPQLMSAMRGAGESVACYQTECYWKDIGRFDDYQQASEDFMAATTRFLPVDNCER
jgi:NDP-sugar pyrophosphorylase family protein